MLTKEQIEELTALEKKATSAPWCWTTENDLQCCGDQRAHIHEYFEDDPPIVACENWHCNDNAMFITAARNAMPELLSERCEAEAIIDQLLAYVSHFADNADGFARDEADQIIVRAKRFLGR